MKEKVKSAPKELIRRGLEDGTERLRLQFRDAAQQGQTDGYGGDQIGDAASGGARQVERGIKNLLKRRGTPKRGRTERAKIPQSGESAAHSGQPGRVQIKTRETVSHTASQDTGNGRIQEAGRDRARRVAQETAARSPHREGADAVSPPGRSEAPPALYSEHTAVKTKDAYIQRQAPSVQAVPQGRREFVQEQGRALVKKQAGRPAPSVGRGNGPGPGRAGPRPLDRSAAPSGGFGSSGIKAGRPGKAGVQRAAGQTVKTAENASRNTIKTAKGAVKTAKQAGTTAQRTAQATQRAAQAARLTARTVAVTARSAVKTTVAAAKAVGAAAQSLAAAIAAGGWVVIVIVLVICLVGMLVASPFGIFFADDSNASDAVSPSAAVAQINSELTDRLEELRADGIYDRVEVQGQPPAWSDVLAVFAAKTAGTGDGVDVAVLDPERVELLRAVFWDMTKITSSAETVEHPANGDTGAWSEEVLTITITPRTPDDMRVFYSFTEEQNEALDELLAISDMLADLVGDLSVSSQEARELLASLPADLSPERRAVLETACRLVGKVNYFWGGKSLVLGWDDRWGTLRQVTAAGSSTTGTYRPYGMDCSGYVDWVFYNVSGGAYVIGHGGGAHAQHTYCASISWDEALPGDLVFYPEDSHVGIVGGRDEDGALRIIHCSSGYNNVVISGTGEFAAVAKPVYYELRDNTGTRKYFQDSYS